MKKIYLIIPVILYIIPIVSATTINYPTPYYYDGKENIEVDKEYLELFEKIMPDINNLELTYSTKNSIRFGGYTDCYHYGRIEVTIYRSQWKEDNYWITRNMIEHELKHVEQCLKGEALNHE